MVKSTQNAHVIASGGGCAVRSLLILTPLPAALTSTDSLLLLHPVYASGSLTQGATPVLLVTAFHFCAASLLWLDALRRERSAVKV